MVAILSTTGIERCPKSFNGLEFTHSDDDGLSTYIHKPCCYEEEEEEERVPRLGGTGDDDDLNTLPNRANRREQYPGTRSEDGRRGPKSSKRGQIWIIRPCNDLRV